MKVLFGALTILSLVVLMTPGPAVGAAPTKTSMPPTCRHHCLGPPYGPTSRTGAIEVDNVSVGSTGCGGFNRSAPSPPSFNLSNGRVIFDEVAGARSCKGSPSAESYEATLGLSNFSFVIRPGIHPDVNLAVRWGSGFLFQGRSWGKPSRGDNFSLEVWTNTTLTDLTSGRSTNYLYLWWAFNRTGRGFGSFSCGNCGVFFHLTHILSTQHYHLQATMTFLIVVRAGAGPNTSETLRLATEGYMDLKRIEYS